jgi:hypothetical protein
MPLYIDARFRLYGKCFNRLKPFESKAVSLMVQPRSARRDSGFEGETRDDLIAASAEVGAES